MDNEQPPARVIGEKLSAARKERKMSLRELAAQADTSASMLSQIENGRAFPSVRSLYNIADALGMPVDYFFPDTSSPEMRTSAPDLPSQMTASDFREASLSAVTSARSMDAAGQPARTPVIHNGSRPRIELKGGVTWTRLTMQPEHDAEFLEITYAPGATSGASLSHHVGREFGLVLEGELVVELGFEQYTLKTGDSIIFDSTTPHRLTNPCTNPMRALWVVLNPLPTE
jgi:transcriptional regulator with XRE-family HTH domain/quercetin dioxygenase-like cupin family protein